MAAHGRSDCFSRVPEGKTCRPAMQCFRIRPKGLTKRPGLHPRVRLTYLHALIYHRPMTNETLQDEALLQRFQAVAEETRFRVVRLLAEGERCVCDLQVELGGAAQSRLSFHLKKLKEAGVVSDRRDGRWVYYSLVPGALDEMRAFLGEVKPREGWLPVVRGGPGCC